MPAWLALYHRTASSALGAVSSSIKFCGSWILLFEPLPLQRLDSGRLPTAVRDLETIQTSLVTECQPQSKPRALSCAPLLTQEVPTPSTSVAETRWTRSGPRYQGPKCMVNTAVRPTCTGPLTPRSAPTLPKASEAGRDTEDTRTRPEAQGRFLRSFLAQVLGRPHCRLPGAFSSPPRQPKRPRSPPEPQPGARTRVPRGGRDRSG